LNRIIRATVNTWNGLRAAAQSEHAFRQELAVLAIAIPAALAIAETAWTRLALVAVIIFILVVELVNTAIEKLADRVTMANDPVIGRVKDMGSAAVGLSLLLAALVWLTAICDRLGLF
jgi:diacylglycerol kinase (ATP)